MESVIDRPAEEQPNTETTEQGTYYLTLDLGEKLESLRRLGIPAPGPHDAYTRDLQGQIKNMLTAALPDTEIQPIYVSDMADDIIGATKGVLGDFKDPIVVSTCPEIAYPSEGLSIDVNRIVDVNGSFLGYGPRPGAKPVERQIQEMGPDVRGKEIVIVEDGIFTGGTIKYLLREFENQGHRVGAVVAGFSCNQSDRSWFDDHGYRVETVLGSDHIEEWVPDHDFLPFVPGSGKVVGTTAGEWVHPLYDHGHASYSKPYIKPYGDAENWASIPAAEVNGVSIASIEMVIDLFKTIAKARPGKEPVRIREVIRSRQRCSVPMEFLPPKFVDLDETVVGNLQEYLRCQS